jgi:hypothetical protein
MPAKNVATRKLEPRPLISDLVPGNPARAGYTDECANR